MPNRPVPAMDAPQDVLPDELFSAAWLQLSIPEAAVEGVVGNLALLSGHYRIIAAALREGEAA